MVPEELERVESSPTFRVPLPPPLFIVFKGIEPGDVAKRFVPFDLAVNITNKRVKFAQGAFGQPPVFVFIAMPKQVSPDFPAIEVSNEDGRIEQF